MFMMRKLPRNLEMQVAYLNTILLKKLYLEVTELRSNTKTMK